MTSNALCMFVDWKVGLLSSIKQTFLEFRSFVAVHTITLHIEEIIRANTESGVQMDLEYIVECSLGHRTSFFYALL